MQEIKQSRKIAPCLISHDNVFQKQWILVSYGNEVSRSFHPFCFLLICELVRHKSGADLLLTQIIADDGVCRVLASAQFLPQPILAWVADLVLAFVALSRSFLGFCLSMTDPNVTHLQSFPSFRKDVLIICKHVFCSWLPSHTPAPTFHTSLLQFSPVCSRT